MLQNSVLFVCLELLCTDLFLQLKSKRLCVSLFMLGFDVSLPATSCGITNVLNLIAQRVMRIYAVILVDCVGRVFWLRALATD